MARGSGSLGSKRALAGALCLVLFGAACPSAHRAEPARATIPSGAVTVAYPYEPPTLDPHAPEGSSIATRDILALLLPRLSAVVQSQQQDDDPLIVTIREDARWSDGRPISADDLRFTWKDAPDRPEFKDVADIVVEEPKRARITLRVPVERWRASLSEIGLLPAHVLGDAAARRKLSTIWPVSGGPFMLTRHRRGLDMTFEANPRAPGGAPRLRRIRIVFVPDASGALELFKQTEVDMLAGYHAPGWRARTSQADASSSAEVRETWAQVVLSSRVSAPMRSALRAAIDGPRIAAGLVQTEGRTACAAPPLAGAPCSPGSGARVKAGKKLRLTLAVSEEDDLLFLVARAIQRQAARAGIDVQPVALEHATLWRDWLRTDRFDLALLLHRTVTPSAPWLDGARVMPLYRAIDVIAARGVRDYHAGPNGPFDSARSWTREER